MTRGWRWPLATLAFLAWYVLAVTDALHALLDEYKGRRHWRQERVNHVV